MQTELQLQKKHEFATSVRNVFVNKKMQCYGNFLSYNLSISSTQKFYLIQYNLIDSGNQLTSVIK